MDSYNHMSSIKVDDSKASLRIRCLRAWRLGVCSSAPELAAAARRPPARARRAHLLQAPRAGGLEAAAGRSSSGEVTRTHYARARALY